MLKADKGKEKEVGGKKKRNRNRLLDICIIACFRYVDTNAI
jgi:hypothetical protein